MISKDLEDLNAAVASDSSDYGAGGQEEGDGDERRSLIRNAEIIMRDDLAMYRSIRTSAIGSRTPALAEQTTADPAITTGSAMTTLSKPQEDTAEEVEITFGKEQDGASDDGGETGDADVNKHVGSMHAFKQGAGDRAKEEFKDFEDWLRSRQSDVWLHVKLLFLFVMLPATGIAAILFYLADNPPCGYEQCNMEQQQQGPVGIFRNPAHQASASWWLLFICCRQVITFSMARAFDAIVIDYVALRTKLMNRILGPHLTLFVVGSRGWPLITFSWSALDFILLYGSTHFANHWYERCVVSFRHRGQVNC
jgi:hypothetical protein